MVTTEMRAAASIAPYCNNCGYELTGCVESAKCPECGRPLVEVLTRAPRYLEKGKRYRSKATIFGMPVIDIALGPKNGELRGRARGFIAIGDVATGVLAIGGVARGLVAFGGIAMGVFAIGGASIGLFGAIGGSALSALVAAGGCAVGGLAIGGAAIGIIAQGAAAFGMFGRGGNVAASPAAAEVFDKLSWLLGAWPPTPTSFLQPIAIVAVTSIALSLVIALIAALRINSAGDVD